MSPRANLIEIFSTFLQFDADRVKGWTVDPKLRRSMQRCLSQSTQKEASEEFWALYWYTIWQNQLSPLAKAHLCAYLQEVCYWAVKTTTTGFSSTQYQVGDYFQMAMVRMERILQGFDLKQSLSLKSYARIAFSNVIKDILRQHQEIYICTDWALLSKISRRRLVQSLENGGLSTATIAQYVLAWTCFQTLYAPSQIPRATTTTRKLAKPDPATWEAIAQLYNTQRHTQVHSAEPASSPESLEKWLKTCAKFVRSYLYPTVISINAPRPGQEEGELLDDLHLPQTLSLFSKIEEASNRDQTTQINRVLVEALAGLEPQLAQLLQLYYAQGLTQQQIAQQLSVKQYTVSRRLTKAKQLLLKALAGWSQEVLHISPNTEVLEYTSVVLEEWLKVHYRPS